MKYDSNKIIVLIGFPRSGTTWFANLFNTHSKIIYRHEFLGRSYKKIPYKLYFALKNNFGLTPKEHSNLLTLIATPDTVTDRPPFFYKESIRIKNPKLHHIAWLIANSFKIFSHCYSWLFTPKKNKKHTFLMKETRSIIQMDSILEGMKPDATIMLFRNPYECAASHLNGIKINALPAITDKIKNRWLHQHAKQPYVEELVSQKIDFSCLLDAEFIAVQWRVYNDFLLKVYSNSPETLICNYDEFCKCPLKKVQQIYTKLSLQFNEAIQHFIYNSSHKNNFNLFQIDAANNYYSVFKNNSSRYKNQLNEEEINSINKHTDSLYQQLIEVSL